MSELPNWVWDLVMHLEREEFEHPNLYVRGGDDTYLASPWCPASVLKLVPDDVRAVAKGIAAYNAGRAVLDTHGGAK